MNIKLTIAYDGSCYNGSQAQPEKTSVEDKIQEVLHSLHIYTKLIFSGRTDKDVHASGQVVSCIIPVYWHDLKRLKKSMNNKLPQSIRIKYIQLVSSDFHARYSAKKRIYRYIVSTKEVSPFNSKYVTYHPKELDADKIQNAIKEFIGRHDFEFYSKRGSGIKTTIREIYDVKFYKYKDYYIFKFTANGYLRSQIRLMMGMILNISDQKLTIEDLIKQLQKKERTLKKPALANGLYLAKINY